MTGGDVARIAGRGRIAIGSAPVLAPRRAGRPRIGSDADAAGATVLARATGIRDVVIGAIALHTLGTAQVGPRRQRTGAVVDAVDPAATPAVRRQLAPTAVARVVAMAGIAIAAQTWAAAQMAQ